MDYLEILRQYFGYDSFRGIQKDIVESIGAGRDTLGLMPTGGGKSITFQVPALAMDGVCLVITPLISLMKDQVSHLNDRGIKAAYVNSSMTRNEMLQTLDNVILGGVKFLYVSPERLSVESFRTKLYYMKVCLIAVDEAHCISQWGYDFRPSYLNISQVRELLPDVPVLALTATATEAVVEDIQRQLKFSEPNVFKMSFKRENLVYVTRKTEAKFNELVHILDSVSGTAIVYTRSRQGTKDIAGKLMKCGVSATFYHAGLDFAVKDQRQQDWQEDKVRVMVATNAFGMGIDKPDVRLVVHMDAPDSIEAYFQEAGRGGRDGKRSYAVLLYDNRDIVKLRGRVAEAFLPKDYLRKVYDHLAYYFQVAVDCGEGAVYELQMDRFCITFKHYPARVESALTILQRAGYIHYDADPDNNPRAQFLVTREQLYGLHHLSPAEESVISTLLRKYGFLFSELGYIHLGVIASLTSLSEDRVHQILKELSRLKIIKYVPRRDVPRIIYVRQRVDSERLRFPKEVYEDLRERMEERIDAMVDYLESENECRQTVLLKYFGEKAEPCGMCNVCLDGKAQATDSVREKIIELVKGNDGTLVSELSKLNVPRAELFATIEAMREEGLLRLDGSRIFL